MAESKERDQRSHEPMTNRELIDHAKRLTAELKHRQKLPKSALVATQNEPSQQDVCSALFDVAAATQAALIANDCPGV